MVWRGGLCEISTDRGQGHIMNGTGIFFALFPAANKKLKEQDYWGISPSITLKTVKIYLSRDTQAGISQSSLLSSPHKCLVRTKNWGEKLKLEKLNDPPSLGLTLKIEFMGRTRQFEWK